MVTLEQYLNKKGDFSQQLTFINKYMPKLLERVRKESNKEVFQGEYLKLCHWYQSNVSLTSYLKTSKEARLFLEHLIEYHRILEAVEPKVTFLTPQEKNKIMEERAKIKPVSPEEDAKALERTIQTLYPG
ncbi:MAG: hypothetical protein WC413_03610 [Candidatus Nanoarchaeia archaeon]